MKNEQRTGGRRPLSETDPSKTFALKVPGSMKEKLDKIEKDKIRTALGYLVKLEGV